MKRTLFTALLVMVGACVITRVTSAPTTTSSPLSSNKAMTSATNSKSSDDAKKKLAPLKTGKTVETPSEDSNVRKKKSEEFIQFGNQQNKPAGMVDDALSGIATKKNSDMKRQQGYSDLLDQSVDEEESTAESEPIASLLNNDDKGEAVRGDDIPFSNDGELENESYLSGNVLGVPMESQLQDDSQSSYRGLREQARDRFSNEWFGREDEYANRRRRRNIVRNDRNFRKRSLRTTAEKLMNMRGGAGRWKRDVRFHEDDVLNFLNLLAAAEYAKEKEEKQQELERLPESDYLWPPRTAFQEDSPLDNPGGIDNYYGYYYVPGQSFEVDLMGKMMADAKDNPEMLMLNPDEIGSMKRSFYPAVDYRSLGIIGARKRRRQHQQSLPLEIDDDFDEDAHNGGSWGRIRGNWNHNEPNLRQILGNYNSLDVSDNQDSSESDESSEVNNYGGRKSESDKLYTLGELLNGKSEVEDYRYPVYRRLI